MKSLLLVFALLTATFTALAENDGREVDRGPAAVESAKEGGDRSPASTSSKKGKAAKKDYDESDINLRAPDQSGETTEGNPMAPGVPCPQGICRDKVAPGSFADSPPIQPKGDQGKDAPDTDAGDKTKTK